MYLAILLLAGIFYALVVCCVWLVEKVFGRRDREDSGVQHEDLDKHRFVEYKQDAPDTWPFIATTEDIQCYKHQKPLCDECRMDFNVVNQLIQNKEYMILFLTHDQEGRYLLIESTIVAYYKNSIGSEHNRESSPFTSLLVENMSSEDHVGAVTLAAFVCYTYFGEATSILSSILDNAIRHYCSLNRAYLKGTDETEDNKAEYKEDTVDDEQIHKAIETHAELDEYCT